MWRAERGEGKRGVAKRSASDGRGSVLDVSCIALVGSALAPTRKPRLTVARLRGELTVVAGFVESMIADSVTGLWGGPWRDP